MTAPTRWADRGKWAESQVQTWLDRRTAAETGFAYHRYPDSRAASRGSKLTLIAAQPADFLIGRLTMAGKTACHLEVKESKELRRLPKTKIGQYGKLKLFDLAGFDTIILVYRSSHRDWVAFTSRELFCYDECPASFPFEGLVSYESAAQALDAFFPY